MILWRWQKLGRFVGWALLVIALLYITFCGSAFSLFNHPAQAQSPSPSSSLEELQHQRDQLDEKIEVYNETDERYQKAEDQTNKSLRDLSKTIQSTDAWITNT
ncbi:MAG: hypothetical protein AAFZ17_19655, partial [Cyanobacteria bacterium J06650_10]